MNKFLKGLFYFFFAGFGGLIGSQAATFLSLHLTLYRELSKTALTINNIGIAIIGILIGFIVAPYAYNLFTKFIDRIILALQRLSLQEILLGAMGLIFGLIIAFFTILPLTLTNFSFSEIPIIGPYLLPFLSIFITIFWVYLSVYFATRTAVVHSFGQLFTSSKGAHFSTRMPKVLDTSAIIDGRISDIARTGFIEGSIIIPRFILDEIQQLADSLDFLKRNRGKRGLDILQQLRKEFNLEVMDKNYPDLSVDAKLVKLAQDLQGALLTTDYNLNKIAQLQGINTFNINELANAVKPVVLPGETLTISLLKSGKEANQAVGYMQDGTMVVVENARAKIGEEVVIEVTSVIQTVAGKMIFGKIKA